MSVELKYSEECTDKDTPALCIPSLRRGTSSNDAVRGVPVEQPSRMLSIRVANANDKVAGKRDIVKEVYPYQETMTYSRESKHKVFILYSRGIIYDEVEIRVLKNKAGMVLLPYSCSM